MGASNRPLLGLSLVGDTLPKWLDFMNYCRSRREDGDLEGEDRLDSCCNLVDSLDTGNILTFVIFYIFDKNN